MPIHTDLLCLQVPLLVKIGLATATPLIAAIPEVAPAKGGATVVVLAATRGVSEVQQVVKIAFL